MPTVPRPRAQRALGAVSQRTPSRNMAVSLRARSCWRAVSQHCCLRPRSRYNFCITTQVPCRAHHVPCRSIVLCAHAAVSQRCHSLYRDLKVAPATIQFLYRDTHPQRPSLRALAPLAFLAGRPYRRPPDRDVAMLWSSRGALLAVSWPQLRAPVRLCHDTMHFIVTKCKNGQKPSLLPAPLFFFSLFFHSFFFFI